MTALRLLCLPYAGGSAARVYREWVPALAQTVRVSPVELPGRGARLPEPLLTSVDALVDDVLATVLPIVDGPYAVFGHSLGALVAFELARRLEHRYGRPAVHLLVSGHGAPQGPATPHDDYLLPDAQFRQRLRELAGTPEEILEHDELLELFAPIMRADFQAADTYSYRPAPKLTCPMTVYGGREDPEAPPDTLPGWAEQTTGTAEVRVLPGNHFFLHHRQDDLLADVAGRLGTALADVARMSPERTS